MKWHTQAGNINTNLKFEVNFTLPALSMTNGGTWKSGHSSDKCKVPEDFGSKYVKGRPT